MAAPATDAALFRAKTGDGKAPCANPRRRVADLVNWVAEQTA